MRHQCSSALTRQDRRRRRPCFPRCARRSATHQKHCQERGAPRRVAGLRWYAAAGHLLSMIPAVADAAARGAGRPGRHMSQIFVDPYLLCAQGCLLVLVYDFLRGLRADSRQCRPELDNWCSSRTNAQPTLHPNRNGGLMFVWRRPSWREECRSLAIALERLAHVTEAMAPDVSVAAQTRAGAIAMGNLLVVPLSARPRCVANRTLREYLA